MLQRRVMPVSNSRTGLRSNQLSSTSEYINNIWRTSVKWLRRTCTQSTKLDVENDWLESKEQSSITQPPVEDHTRENHRNLAPLTTQLAASCAMYTPPETGVFLSAGCMGTGAAP